MTVPVPTEPPETPGGHTETNPAGSGGSVDAGRQEAPVDGDARGPWGCSCPSWDAMTLLDQLGLTAAEGKIT